MTLFDYIVLGVIGISVLLSVLRGFVRESLSLASWVIAFVVAKLYMLQVEPLLPEAIPGEALRLLAAFLILFLLTLLVCSLLAMVLGEIFRKAGLGWVDRSLGAVFGLARGLVMICLAVLLGGLTSLPGEPFWRNALLSPPLEAAVTQLLPWLPQDVAKHIKYD